MVRRRDTPDVLRFAKSSMTSRGAPRVLRSAACAAALVLVLGCETVSLAPVDPPVLEDLGPAMVRAGNSEIWAVLDFRFAAGNIGSDWLIVDLAVTAADRRSARVHRDGIFIRTPKGTRIALPSQEEYLSVHGQLQSALRRADVASSPMWAYFPASRRQCDFQFFAGPGGTTYNHVEVNDRRACGERLVFRIPGGVQPGRWVVGIDLEESELRIPFDLT